MIFIRGWMNSRIVTSCNLQINRQLTVLYACNIDKGPLLRADWHIVATTVNTDIYYATYLHNS